MTILNLLRAKAHSAGLIDPLSRPARLFGLGLSGSETYSLRKSFSTR